MCRFEQLNHLAEQVDLALGTKVEIATEHLFHAGMYARTIRLQAGVVLTGALMKIETILIFNGMADVWTGHGWERIGGYQVLAGSAMRKQVFVTRSAVEMTMVFPTAATTVDEAEREFTDEFERLMSRKAA